MKDRHEVLAALSRAEVDYVKVQVESKTVWGFGDAEWKAKALRAAAEIIRESGWRPIAEAEDGVKLDVVGQHTKAVKSGWLRGLGYYKAEAIRDGFTYFFMYPAPPQEGE